MYGRIDGRTGYVKDSIFIELSEKTRGFNPEMNQYQVGSLVC